LGKRFRNHLTRPRFWWRMFVFIILAWFIGVGALAFTIIVRANTPIGDVATESADAIVVLGAGVRRDGSANSALRRRAHLASELYHAGYASNMVCSGGQAPDRPNSEAFACRQVLLAQGVPNEAIILEESSRSTEENALYTSTIAQANNWQELIIVSDGFHILRAEFLFNKIGLSVQGAPVSSEHLRRSYLTSQVMREMVAFHWQIFKDTLGLPYTHVP
jgi:uncharacterized SAM-binding protein YcdF (DUF218 family)